MEEKKIYRAALDTFGKAAQMFVAVEEMAELMKELSKNLRGADNILGIVDEIADVEIMLGQLKELFACEGAVAFRKQGKLARLEGLIKERRGQQ